MKKLLKIVLSLLILALLIFGIWLGVNLWPEKKMEPSLWTEADLALPEDPAGNGFRLLVQMRMNPNPKFDALEIPHEEGWILGKIENYNWPSLPPERVSLFWDQAKVLAPSLASFIQNHSEALQEYQKILDAPQFIDVDSPSTPLSKEERRRESILLNNLHNLATWNVIHLVLQGNVSEAATTWLKLFQMDQSLLNSARSISHHLGAIRALDHDFNLISLLRLHPPPEGGDKIQQALQDFDLDKVSFRRALIAEYLHQTAAADAVVAGKNEGQSFFYRIGFHRALFQKETNDFFRRLDEWSKGPGATGMKETSDRIPTVTELSKHPESLAAPKNSPQERSFYREYQSQGTGRLWHFRWFSHPSVKSLRYTLLYSWLRKYFHEMKEFSYLKGELQKKQVQLLSAPLFLKSPETQGAETKSSETRPVETHSAETKEAEMMDPQKDAL